MIRRLASWALLALFVLGWAVTFRPVALGGPSTYVVVTGTSMEPTYHDGDLVVLRAQETYSVGDIVTFPVPEGTPGSGALIIHRIAGGTESGFTIQGDNNPNIDEWSPAAADVLGAEWFTVPSGGKVLRGAMDPTLLAAVAGGLITMFVLMKPGPSRKEPDDDHTSQHPGSDGGCEIDAASEPKATTDTPAVQHV